MPLMKSMKANVNKESTFPIHLSNDSNRLKFNNGFEDKRKFHPMPYKWRHEILNSDTFKIHALAIGRLNSGLFT